ncbi:MAG: hypothetical protein ACE5NM_03610 [Sedimentisphaerales bacterium]
MARQNGMMGRYRVFIIGITMVVLVSAGPALAQFIVQPMRLQLTASPGRRVTHELELQNHNPDTAIEATLTVVYLSQWEDGSWRIIDPNSEADISNFMDHPAILNSCRDWISLSDETVQVDPLTVVPVKITLRVPAGMYGFHCAGIVVSLRTAERTTTEVGVIIEFVVPVLVRVPGRVVQHDVELTDVGMEFRPASGQSPPTTLVSMTVANKGRTLSRLLGMLRVWGFFKDHWRRITEDQLNMTLILPGSELKLTADIGRSLPPSKYRVGGWLFVDGRRVKPMEKEIDFAGDPSTTRIATDAPLDLKPRNIIINSLPGATRTAVLQVFNASDEEVIVKVQKALPPKLKGVAAGPLRGENLDCTDWVTMTPKEFKLPSYGQQNIRIIAKMPNPEAIQACYYALLGLFATYPDGQNAGQTTANICILNQKIQAKPIVYPSGALSLARQTGSKYIVTGMFTNYGNIHFNPKRCRVTVTSIALGVPMSQVLLGGGPGGIMLPLESRSFSGELDFSDYPEGYYRMEMGLEYGPGQVAVNRIGIQVTVQGAQRVIRLVGREEFEKIGVKWR